MDKQLLKEYIDNQPIKIVSKLDLDKEKLEYDKINEPSLESVGKSNPRLCRESY